MSNCSSKCFTLLAFLLAVSSSADSPQVPTGTSYVPIETGEQLSGAFTPDFTRALVARLQTGAARKLENFFREEGFSSGGRPLCFHGQADCYRRMDACMDYDIRFNHLSSVRFRPDMGVNGALQVDFAIKKRHDSSSPYDLTNMDIRLSDPTSVFSWCFINPARHFQHGRLKFTESGSTPGLEVHLFLEPVMQDGQLRIRKIGGSGVRINRMYLQAAGWPDFLINFVFNLGFVRSSIAHMIERETIALVDTYARELLRFQGGYQGFSYSFLPSRAGTDINGISLGFNGGINYLQSEDVCTAGRAPWPTEPGTNPTSTLETFHADSDVGIGVRTVLANNALREAYNRGTFCLNNDAAPFRIGDFCGILPLLCDILPRSLEVLVAARLWPYDLSNPDMLPRVEIAQEGPDGSLLARFSGLNLQMVVRDPDTGQRSNFACLNIDASIEAKANFSGSAVLVRLGSERTQLDGFRGRLLPTDIVSCTGGGDITALFPPEMVQRAITETLIPYFNNTVGQVPFSTDGFRLGCFRVFPDGIGLGGEYTNIYASLYKASTLPSCEAPNGRTNLEVFTGPAEGTVTNNNRPHFEARAADPRGETSCQGFRYAAGFDTMPGPFVPATGCPIGIYASSPNEDLPDGPHVFRIEAKTTAIAGDPVCLPAGRPECSSGVIERHFIVDTQAPTAPQVECESGATKFQWSASADGMTAKKDLRYYWFVEDIADKSRFNSVRAVKDGDRAVSITPELGFQNNGTLKANRTYAFYVKAVDTAGNVSAESNRCIFTTP